MLEFCRPDKAIDEKYGLIPLWETTEKFLREEAHRTVEIAELYELWQKPPFGVRNGLMPI